MRTGIIIFAIFMLFGTCYADRICVEKNSNKFIEYQSGDSPLGTLTANAIKQGYKQNDIEEKYISYSEWIEYRRINIDEPAKEKERQKAELKKQNMKNKEAIIKSKLGLSDKEFTDLKEALGIDE